MDGAVYASYPYSYFTGAGSRLRLALAVSVLSHLLFAAALESVVPQRSAQVSGAAPIAVRLERLPSMAPAGTAVAELEEPPLPRRTERRAAASGSKGSAAPLAEVSATKPDRAAPFPLPQVPDRTVYAARDLDSYPRPVVPLDIGRLSDLFTGNPLAEARFELLIDEHGIVNDVVPAGAGTAGQPGAELRAALAATRFVPARKDGRAVRSRVLLSVRFGQEKREP